AERDRTADLLNAIQALSLLSYSPDEPVAELRALPPLAKIIISFHLRLLSRNQGGPNALD
ncbi:MAG: hypothetical protein P8Y85_09965, partial [Nitrospirota bacterium]